MSDIDDVRTEQAAGGESSPVRSSLTSKLLNRANSAVSSVQSFAATSVLPNSGQSGDASVRREVLKINNQLLLTQKLIESNKDSLTDLAKNDEAVASLIENLDSEAIAQVKDIQDRILRGEDVSAAESRLLVQNLKDLTEGFDKSQVSLEASFLDITGSFKELVLNEDFDREDRRTMIEELSKIANQSDIQNQLSEQQKSAIEDLNRLSEGNLNFTSEQNGQLQKVFNELTQGDVKDAKLQGTLNELNKTLDSAVLTNKELEEALESDAGGISLGDSLEKAGISGLGGTIKSGLVDLALSQVGLSGLGLGDLGFADIAAAGGTLKGGLGKIGGGLGKLGGKAGGLLGKAGGLATGAGGALAGLGKGAGGLLKGGAKIIGKAALPLAAAMSIFDAIQGFNNAAEISGIEPGDLTLGDKIQAGAAAALSGLTFGLVDSKDIFQGINDGMDFLFGEEGVFPSLGDSLGDLLGLFPTEIFSGMVDSIQDSLSGLFGEKGFMGTAKDLLKKAIMFSPLGLMIQGIKLVSDGIQSLFGEDGLISKAGKFFSELPEVASEALGDILETPGFLLEKAKEGVDAMLDYLFGEEGIFSIETVKKAMRSAASAFLPGFVVNKIFGKEEIVVSEPSQGGTSGARGSASLISTPSDTGSTGVRETVRAESSSRRRMERLIERATQANSKPVVVTQPQKQQRVIDRSTSLSDTELAVMQTGFAGI